MIKATIITSGFFINKPLTNIILIDEKKDAIERKNEHTERYERLTVGQLYDIYEKSSAYIKNASDPEEHLTQEHFPTWFKAKYINGKPMEFKITSIKFERI